MPPALSKEQVYGLANVFEHTAQGSVSRRIDHDDDKPWLMEWYFEYKPEAASLLSELQAYTGLNDNQSLLSELAPQHFEIAEVVQENWLEKVYQEHPPFTVGPFFVHGSHYEERVPQGQIGLQIDAATAFGSGEHGTTKGCLIAMLDLKSKGQCPWNVLDMGTGSGILAIAAWKLWQTPITAIDNDPESIRVTRRYQALNGVKDGIGAMQSACGDGFATPLCLERAPYDLIIANILAGPLKEMAQDLKAASDENGYVILSGMLHAQANDVLSIYEGLGFVEKDRIDIGKWSTLVLHNAA